MLEETELVSSMSAATSLATTASFSIGFSGQYPVVSRLLRFLKHSKKVRAIIGEAVPRGNPTKSEEGSAVLTNYLAVENESRQV